MRSAAPNSLVTFCRKPSNSSEEIPLHSGQNVCVASRASRVLVASELKNFQWQDAKHHLISQYWDVELQSKSLESLDEFSAKRITSYFLTLILILFSVKISFLQSTTILNVSLSQILFVTSNFAAITMMITGNAGKSARS